MDNAKLGRIIFANLLSRPLPAYRKFIEATEALEGFRSFLHKGLIRIHHDPYCRHHAKSAGRHGDPTKANLLGQFIIKKGKVHFHYSDPLFARAATSELVNEGLLIEQTLLSLYEWGELDTEEWAQEVGKDLKLIGNSLAEMKSEES